jgi:hypothetical protein
VKTKILKHGTLKLKPPKRTTKRNSTKPAQSTDDYTPEYDPINNPFIPKTPPWRRSAKTTSQAHGNVVTYDPVDHPFVPATQRTTPDPTVSKTSRKHPLYYAAVILALLLPFIILVMLVINPIGEIFRDFQEFNQSLKNDPSLTQPELLDILNRFFESRRNH